MVQHVLDALGDRLVGQVAQRTVRVQAQQHALARKVPPAVIIFIALLEAKDNIDPG
jgi:hypothetical protein